MHIQEDHFIPEIINPDTGEVLPEGEVGELVFTCITKKAFPLIRYRTRDPCYLTRKKCSCGRTHIRMHKPMGRSDDMMVIKGVNVFPSQIETVLLKRGYQANYQIIVDRKGNNDTCLVKVELTPEMAEDTIRSNEAREKELVSKLKSMLGIRVDVKAAAQVHRAKRGQGSSRHRQEKSVQQLRKEKAYAWHALFRFLSSAPGGQCRAGVFFTGWIWQMSCQVGVDHGEQFPFCQEIISFCSWYSRPSSERCGADRRNRGPLKIGRLPQPEDRRGLCPWRCASASRAISFLQNVSPKRFSEASPNVRPKRERVVSSAISSGIPGIHREKTGYSAERLPAVFPPRYGSRCIRHISARFPDIRFEGDLRCFKIFVKRHIGDVEPFGEILHGKCHWSSRENHLPGLLENFGSPLLPHLFKICCLIHIVPFLVVSTGLL